MSLRTQWIARAWLPYLLIGVTWVALGAVLGGPERVGLTSIGLGCLCFGAHGAERRVRSHQRLGDATSSHCG
ncbi:MAG: hypothetical protein L0H96_19370 [Humibacillus sp.]|nr:hypothetical protein [Humibacillus sp.]MDN5779059.1 hypothetical protein [Humibacillus sp.]